MAYRTRKLSAQLGEAKKFESRRVQTVQGRQGVEGGEEVIDILRKLFALFAVICFSGGGLAYMAVSVDVKDRVAEISLRIFLIGASILLALGFYYAFF